MIKLLHILRLLVGNCLTLPIENKTPFIMLPNSKQPDPGYDYVGDGGIRPTRGKQWEVRTNNNCASYAIKRELHMQTEARKLEQANDNIN